MVRKSIGYSYDVDPPPPTPPRIIPPGTVMGGPAYSQPSNDSSSPPSQPPPPPPYKAWTSLPPPSLPFKNSPPPPQKPPAPTRQSPSPPPPSDSGSPSPESSNQEAPESQPPESSSGDTSPAPVPEPSVNSNKNSTSNSKSSTIGAAVGGSLLLIFMIVLVVFMRKRKRKSQLENSKDNSRGNQGDYYNNEKHTNWYHKPSPTEHILKIPPSPGVHWVMPSPLPSPLAPRQQSHDISTNFSGPYHPPMPPPHPGISIGYNNSSFSYEDLATATGGFAKANLLGQGGFGYVYKGVLPNGKEVAVKSLKSGSGQGEREFQAEVDIISRVHHRHLVSLVGYCIAGSQRMLVYEFVPNNSLEYHLHGEDRPTMDWPTRLKIALGSAKGFAYLHEDCHPRIIHRDIKAANILLDFNFEAKVADFGLAKLNSDTHTHVSTRIMGTFGYLAPEYASSGKLTEKSDIYSYGVVLLELISGRRPVDVDADDDDNLVDWARPILMRSTEGGNYEEIVDPKLQGHYKPQEMLRMVACAAACIRHSAKKRPKMSQIVRALEGDVSLDDLNSGLKPGHSGVFGSTSSFDQYDDNPSSGTEMKKFRKVVALSQEFSSGEQRPAGELTHQPSSADQSPDETPSKTQTPDP